MSEKPQTIDAYMQHLPEKQRAVLEPVLAMIREALPAGYEEVISFGMPSWQVPLPAYPDTYNKQPLMFAGLASRKNHKSLYLSGPFSKPEIEQRLISGFAISGKKLDMGQSCIRFKTIEDLDFASLREAIQSMPMKEFIEREKSARATKKR